MLLHTYTVIVQEVGRAPTSARDFWLHVGGAVLFEVCFVGAAILLMRFWSKREIKRMYAEHEVTMKAMRDKHDEWMRAHA